MAISRIDLTGFAGDEIKILVEAFFRACDWLQVDSRTADGVARAIVAHARKHGVDARRLVQVGVASGTTLRLGKELP